MKKISLEEYLRFLRSDREGTVHFLNQIVMMHGFRRFKLKKQASDAVKTMELTDPARSTLTENVSARAFLEFEEVAADLDAMQWKECCLSGIQTLSSKADPQENSDINITVSSLRDPTEVRKSQSKSKSQPIAPAQEEKGDNPNATATGGGTSQSSAASTTIDMPPPSKKAKNVTNSPAKDHPIQKKRGAQVPQAFNDFILC